MDFDRAALKERGKAAFKQNYWKCVLVAFVLGLLTSSASSSSSSTGSENLLAALSGSGDSEESFYLLAALGLIVLGSLMIWIIAMLLKIFVFNPLTVGGSHFFVQNAYNSAASPKLLGMAFRNGRYGNIVLTMFLKQLFTCLWTLLFVIPGIIKSYEYLMIPYLLADNPEMSHQDAFRISKEMMTGNKWNVFVMDMSFYGWILLSVCTLGILGIFYVNPYFYATRAELYLTLCARRGGNY